MSPQGLSRRSQEASRSRQNDPKRRPGAAQEALQRLQETPKERPGVARSTPGRPKLTPGVPQEAPRRRQVRPRAYQTSPRAPQEPPRRNFRAQNVQKPRKIRGFAVTEPPKPRFGYVYRAQSAAKPLFWTPEIFKTTYFTMVLGAAKRRGHTIVLWTKLVQTYSQHREGPVQLDMLI